MSIEALLTSFEWNTESARALRRAEMVTAEACAFQKANHSPLADLDFELRGEMGRSIGEVVDEACVALSSCGYPSRHPGAFAHMVPPPATISIIGDFLKASFNQCAFTVEQAPLAPALERAVLDWIKATLNLPSESAGLVTSGGTISNLTAAFLARERGKRLAPDARRCAIFTDQSHFSVRKALRLLDIPVDAHFVIETEGDGSFTRTSFVETVRRSERAGYRPFLLVCTAGTTNAGLIEPIGDFSDLARRTGAWLHIDGAHGAYIALTHRLDPGYWAVADSVSWDPHKTLFATYPAGALLIRDPAEKAVLEQAAEYAFQNGAVEHPAKAHLEGSRGLEALKVWMTIRHFGRAGFALLAEHLTSAAATLAELIDAHSEFVLLSAPQTNIVCFRWTGSRGADLDRVNSAAQQAMYDEGEYLLSQTRLGGHVALRAVIQNPVTDHSHLKGMLERLAEIAIEIAHPAPYRSGYTSGVATC
jgi:glutamate/tyrosine decarboxylase-like PLP-dependent enzyme